jgi:hypothetical protein
MDFSLARNARIRQDSVTVGLSVAKELDRRNQPDIEFVLGELVRKVAGQIKVKTAALWQPSIEKFDQRLRIEVRHRSESIFPDICHDRSHVRVATGPIIAGEDPQTARFGN